MAITPADIEQMTFSEAKKHGYNTEEVDAFLDLSGQHRAQLVDTLLDWGERPSPTRINQVGQRTGIVITHSTSLMPHRPRHVIRAPPAPRSLFSDSLNG